MIAIHTIDFNLNSPVILFPLALDTRQNDRRISRTKTLDGISDEWTWQTINEYPQ